MHKRKDAGAVGILGREPGLVQDFFVVCSGTAYVMNFVRKRRFRPRPSWVSWDDAIAGQQNWDRTDHINGVVPFAGTEVNRFLCRSQGRREVRTTA